MQDTYFFPPDAKVPRIATAYTYYDGKGLNRFPDQPIVEGSMIYSADYPARGPKKLFAGGAGLNSTAMDYARFAQMILNGGKLGNTRILSRKTVELMSHDQLGKIDPDQAFARCQVPQAEERSAQTAPFGGDVVVAHDDAARIEHGDGGSRRKVIRKVVH